MDQEDDYRVGYGKPPRNSQFRKGSSGNPNGRPRAPTGPDSHLMQELSKPIIVTENGQRKSISKGQAFARQLIHKAISGEATATRLLYRHLERVQARLDAIAASQPVEHRVVTADDLSDEELMAIIASGTTTTKGEDVD